MATEVAIAVSACAPGSNCCGAPARARPFARRLAGAGGGATVWAAALLVTGVFAWLLTDIVRNGLPVLSWDYLTTVPRNAGRAGGIAPILVSTLMILSVCMAVSLPLGVGAAVFLSEF